MGRFSYTKMGYIIYKEYVYNQEIGVCDECDLYDVCGNSEVEINVEINCQYEKVYKKNVKLTRALKLKDVFENELSEEKS